MCGIVGAVHFSESVLPEKLLIDMRDRMMTRGPDSAGVWIKNGVGLGHRRLSIIDLSPSAHQPMKNEVTSDVVVFNGEVYNFQSLRKELLNLGHRFFSESDTEVVLKAYQEWGTACVERFIGMFAFAVWDEKKQGLFLARDRLGIKPLYYFRNSNVFLFASRLGALAPHPACPRTIDPDALSLYLEIGFVPAPLAIWKGVYKLEPGHTLWIDATNTKKTIYWDIDKFAPKFSSTLHSDEELTNQFEEILLDSIKLRLIADVPLGAFLSGGIDSSLVVALMAKLSKHPPKTFTIGFSEAEYDESNYAKSIAKHLGTEHHERIMKSSDLLELMEDNTRNYDEPFADWSSLPTMMVSKFAREFVTVCLSGDGGDELFAGYHYYPLLKKFRSLFFLPHAIRKTLGNQLVRTGAHQLILAGQALGQKDLTQCFAFMRSMIKDFNSSTLFPGKTAEVGALFEERATGLPRLDPISQATRLDLAYYLPDDILQKVDVASMAFSLEARVPLLDHRVVEFSQSLSIRRKLRGKTTKYLLKNLLRRHVPEKLFQRPKSGFCVPIKEWFRNELKPMLLEELSPNRIEAFGYISSPEVQKLISLHLSQKRDTQPILWILLSLLRWNDEIKKIPIFSVSGANYFPPSPKKVLTNNS